MIILLYGEHDVAINRRKSEIKGEFSGDQIWEFEGKSADIESISQALGAQSLFGTEPKLIIITGVLANKTLLENLMVPATETTLMLIENKKVTAAQLSSLQKQFPALIPQEYKLDSGIFRFVEALDVGGIKSLSLFQSELSDEAPEIIFAMLTRQFRLLLLAKEQATDGPDEWQRMSPWQRQKLESQAKRFTASQLAEAYHRLLIIDSLHKLGQYPGTLGGAIELFLLQLGEEKGKSS